MHRDPRTGIYYVSVPSPAKGGKAHRRSTGTKNVKLAKEMEARWRDDALRQRNLGESPKYGYDELMDWYLEEVSPKKRSHDRDLFSAVKLDAYFSKKVLADCSPADAEEYVDGRRDDGVKDSTITRELGLLSAALNAARRSPKRWPRWNIANFCNGMTPGQSEDRIRFLRRPWESARLLNAEKMPYQQDLTLLGLNTGMRKGEMLGCEVSRIDLARRCIYLDPEDQKNGRYGLVSLNDTALAAVQRRLRFIAEHCPAATHLFSTEEGSPLKWVHKGYKAMCARAGVDNFTIHDLRHTFASWMVQDGEDLTRVKEAMRHASIQTTMKYAHLRNEDVTAAVYRLDGTTAR